MSEEEKFDGKKATRFLLDEVGQWDTGLKFSRPKAKPICIIYFPENMVFGMSGDSLPNRMMGILNGFDDQISANPKGYWKQYYWFCFSKSDIDAPEFQVFYDKDFTEINFAELKELILHQSQKLNHE